MTFMFILDSREEIVETARHRAVGLEVFSEVCGCLEEVHLCEVGTFGKLSGLWDGGRHAISLKELAELLVLQDDVYVGGGTKSDGLFCKSVYVCCGSLINSCEEEMVSVEGISLRDPVMVLVDCGEELEMNEED